MDNMKRFVSFLLCFVMLLGFLPANAFAAGETTKTPVDALVIFSDLHTNKSNYKESTVKDIFDEFADLPVSSVTSAGDAFSVNEDNSSSNGPYTGETSIINGYIRSAMDDPDMPIHYVWSDHDRYAVQEDGSTLLDKTSHLVYGAGDDGIYGTGDDGNYYIYLLSMADICTNDRYNAGFSSNRANNGFTASVDKAITNFQADAAKLLKDRPLLIVSHQPLLDNRNDNGNAYKWCTAINTVAENMDVAFFFGHNHKYDKSSDYYYAKGSTMSVCSDSSGNAQNVKLNFAHICAGYMEPTSTGSYDKTTTRQGTVMAITIYEDSIQYTTYDKDGVYKGNYALNETVTRMNKATTGGTDSGETTEPEVTVEPVYDVFGSGISVAAPGIVEVAVEENLAPEYDATRYTAYASYDIVVDDGYEQGTKATVTIPTPGHFDLGKPAVVLFKGEAIGMDTYLGDGITFTTDHFSVYDVAQTASVAADTTLNGYHKVTVDPVDDVDELSVDWVTFREYEAEIPAHARNKYVLDTDGVNANAKYLIVSTVGNGTRYALTNNSGDVDKTEVYVSNGVVDVAAADVGNIVWTFSGSGTIKNGSHYLRLPDSTLSLDKDSYTTFTFNNRNNDGSYRIYWKENYWGRDYYYWFNYDGESGRWIGASTSVINIIGGSSIPTATKSVYLYKYDSSYETDLVPEKLGLYYRIDANNSNLILEDVAPNLSEAEVIEMLQERITIQKATKKDASGSFTDVAECADTDVDWDIESGYNGLTGYYAVTISYEGVTLGVAQVEVKEKEAWYGAVGPQSVTVEMGTSAGMALAAVKAAVTVYSATNNQGDNAIAIPDSNVTWEWDQTGDKYDPNRPGNYRVRVKAGDNLLGEVQVRVNVSYGEDEDESNEVIIGGGKKTVYVLSSGAPSGTVLIADKNKDGDVNVLANVNSNPGNVATKVIYGDCDGDGDSEYYIELSDADAVNAEWTVSSGSGYRFQNQNEYLQYNSGLQVSGSSTTWSYSNNRLSYTTGGWFSQTYYIQYDGGWKANTTTKNVYFYVSQKVDGSISYTMSAEGLDQYLTKDSMSAKLNYALLANGDVANPLPSGGSYKFLPVNDKNGIIDDIDQSNGTIHFTGDTGSALVRVSYTWIQDGQSYEVYKYVTVTATAPDNYPQYSNEGAVKVNKTGTGIDFQSTGIAQVEISATGVPMGRGIDIIVMLDLSSSMLRHSYCGNTSCNDSNCSEVTRLEELQGALKSMENYLKASGNADRMRIAIADFNGFFGDNGVKSGTPYDRDSSDNMGGQLNPSSGDHRSGVVYNPETGEVIYNPRTGTGSISADAFVTVDKMDIEKVNAQLDTQGAKKGTNYDYAFDMIYQLGYAIQTENERTGNTDRELVVIFMSDGAPNQYNYYHSTGGSGDASANADENYKWNKWLQGRMVDSDYTNSNKTHSYYYDTNDYDGDGIYNEHRMASAIKGEIKEPFYEVVRKNQNGTGKDAVTDLLESTGKDNLYKIPGLGATMYSIGFHIKNDGDITEKSVHHVLEQIASSPEMYIQANDKDALAKAFSTITSDVLYAAYNARYVDQMGKDYDLKLGAMKDKDGVTLTKENKIEVIEYEVYTRADVLNEVCEEDRIGDRKVNDKGEFICKVLETVTFNAAGTEAYSSLLGEGNNILTDGIIRAKNFYYNTTTKPVTITDKDANGDFIVNIPTGVDEHDLTTGNSNVLPAESFYWGMGTVKTTELALRYYVYLTGTMEGNRAAGSYPTNTFANLYYDNYVGNPCHKDTVSPVLPWKEANVSYAFYLVDEQGRVVVNQTTGETGTFANKIAVTNPVVHSTIKLNADATEVNSALIAAAGVLPEGYTLYDAIYDTNGNIVRGATYDVKVDSDGEGEWAITGPKFNTQQKNGTTYVMQHNTADSSAYSNAAASVNEYDYSHTVVWFAVVWKIQPLPDTVVVDYGLPVEISVLVNDMFGTNGKLAGVGAVDTKGVTMDGHTATNVLNSTTYEGTYGNATANTVTGKVRYSLKTMEMNSHEQFLYSVNYTGNENAGYYYETVTVIPATTIYFEDTGNSGSSFVTYGSYTWNYSKNAWGDYAPKNENDTGLWTVVGEQDENATQGEDRPGKYALTDANNIYGYDGVNLNMSTFSLGSAHKATVDYDNYASAEFSFYGTGFDIISMTDVTTGTILVDVYQETETDVWTKAHAFAVDTYYGFAKVAGDANADGVVEDGEMIWVVDPSVSDSIYQVPVMRMKNRPYGHYRVVIKVIYDGGFDHVNPSNKDGTYDFYLDAIRIYDPAKDGEGNSVIQEAYTADGEGWPSYIELRQALLSADSFDDVANEVLPDDMKMTGLVFIDGNPEVDNAEISDYASYGPNNEIYLAPGQRVAFLLETPANIANVHIGISLATKGETATYTISNIALMDGEDGKKLGDYYNYKTYSLDTATDMYYDLSGWKSDIIVISNTGNRPENDTTGVISITNIKSTYKTDPNGNNTGVVTPGKGEDSTEQPEAIEEQNLTSVYMTRAAAKAVTMSLNRPAEEPPEEPETPETPETPEVPEEPETPEEPEIPETPEEPEEPEVFDPQMVHVKLSQDEIKVGQKVLVTVTTSSDVDYVIINGEKVTMYNGSGKRSWKLNVTGEKVGTMTIEVVCGNSEGAESEAVTKRVKVKAKGLLGLLDDLFD